MSEGSDFDYKPTTQELRARTAAKRNRPVRSTRPKKEYKEEIVLTDSEEESVRKPVQRAVRGIHIDRTDRHRRERILSETPSVQSSRSGQCWSPGTIQQSTDKVISSIEELRPQLSEARMAQPTSDSMAELLKIMMEMNERDKRDRDRRDEERRQEEKLERDRRDEERREEESRREERRIQREQGFRREAEEREAKLLLALKEAQPAVPQTIHLDNTKLPTMTKGEEIEPFIELLESALTVGRVPADKCLTKLHAALDTETKLLIKDTITNPVATYEEVKLALTGQSQLSFTAASEALTTLDEGKIAKLPIRQGMIKWPISLGKRPQKQLHGTKLTCTGL